jgi:predicted phosphodiesterase
MKLWVMSDLHQERGETQWLGAIPDHDAVILAGDIHRTPAEAISYAEAIFTKPVIYVAGNHEFWSKNMDEEIALGRKQSLQSLLVRFLEDEEAIIGGVHFIGATLWTDFLLFGPENEEACRREASLSMPDYSIIHEWADEDRNSSRKFSTKRSQARHAASVAFLQDALKRHPNLPKVVVTHHAPFQRTAPIGSNDSFLSAAFASDLSSLIAEHEPQVWVHGHVHDQLYYKVGNTRIACNSLGGRTTQFNSTFVIEVFEGGA